MTTAMLSTQILLPIVLKMTGLCWFTLSPFDKIVSCISSLFRLTVETDMETSTWFPYFTSDSPNFHIVTKSTDSMEHGTTEEKLSSKQGKCIIIIIIANFYTRFSHEAQSAYSVLLPRSLDTFQCRTYSAQFPLPREHSLPGIAAYNGAGKFKHNNLSPPTGSPFIHLGREQQCG